MNTNKCARSIIANCAEYKDAERGCAKCVVAAPTYRFLEVTSSVNSVECSFTCENAATNACATVDLSKRPTTTGGNCKCLTCTKNN